MVTNRPNIVTACVCLTILSHFHFFGHFGMLQSVISILDISACFSLLFQYSMGGNPWEWDDLSILSMCEYPSPVRCDSRKHGGQVLSLGPGTH